MNEEEALKCLELSKKYWDEGKKEKAIKLAHKSVAMHRCNDTVSCLNKIKPSSVKEEVHNSAIDREYTEEQVESVRKIKDCGSDFYAILDVAKTADDV